MKTTITNQTTGEVITLSKFVIDDTYPQWVYGQTRCRGAMELISLLSSLEKGEHTGPDSMGLTVHCTPVVFDQDPPLPDIPLDAYSIKVGGLEVGAIIQIREGRWFWTVSGGPRFLSSALDDCKRDAKAYFE